MHGVLAAYPGDWLLVLDNAPGLAAVEAFLLPAGRGRDELAGLERRREELYRELGRVGDFRRGSLTRCAVSAASQAARALPRVILGTGRSGT